MGRWHNLGEFVLGALAAGHRADRSLLSPASAFARVLTGVPQIIGGGRFFDRAGNRVPQPGATYDSSGVRQAVEQLTHPD